MNLQPHILIVIVNYKGCKDTIDCLEAVSRLSYENYQVVVCDNQSNDGSVEEIFRWSMEGVSDTQQLETIQQLSKGSQSIKLDAQIVQPETLETRTQCRMLGSKLLIVPTKRNLGFAGANNIGLRYALNAECFDYVWLLNNDTVCQHDSLTKMVERLENEHSPSTCGSRVMHYFRPNSIQALGGARFNLWTGISSTTFGRDLSDDQIINHREIECKLNFITGCSWLVPVNFIRNIGLMQEDYFLYCEEIDWCLRARGKFNLVYAEDAVVYHKEGASIGSPSGSRKSSLFSDFFIFRNKLKVIQRFNPIAYPLAWLVSLMQSVNRVRQGSPDKALMILRVLLGKRTW